MIKDDQTLHQMHIFIKMSKHLIIILRMANSNHPQMEKIRIMVLMVDDHIRMSMPEINDEDYLPPVTELEDDEYREGPGDYDSPEYF